MQSLVHFFIDRRTRYVLAWVVLAIAIVGRGRQAWVNCEVADRSDGNDGHTAIDFGGQWMLGRLLVLGHGRDLYARPVHLAVARESYAHDREPPGRNIHDAERLVGWYPGLPDDPVGGPLYPPVHAFVMAPVARIDDPQIAYRVTQGVMFLALFAAGLGVRYLSHGRWWWPVATAFLVMYPGCRAGLDLAQNSPLTVGLLVWGWALTVRGRPAWGGVLWGLLAFKPVWAVSFLAALLLLRQWRAALAMASTGAGLVLLTLPFVGVRAWLDWLHVGGLAAETYAIDEAWISLSRDLFGVPRRFLLDFRDGAAVNDRPAVALAGWALWLIVAGVTFAVVRASRSDGLRPPLAALVLLAAWLCTYRFMYYDSLVAALGVVVLLADPRPFFRREWWPVASWAVAFVGLMFAIENVTVPLRIEVTARVGYFNREVAGDDGHPTTTAPKVRFTSGDDYPWDTLAVAILWAWCVRTSWNSRKAEMGSAGDAAQSIKGGPDID